MMLDCMSTDEEPPICPTCNHHHHEGVKCSQCGHVGKSRFFEKMKAKALYLSTLAIHHFSCCNVGMWQTSVELRRILSVCASTEFDNLEERSFHSVGFVGDIPVSVVRWRLVAADVSTEEAVIALPSVSTPSSTSGVSHVAIIDRVGVLECYRRRGYARTHLENVVDTIKQQYGYVNSVSKIAINVPVDHGGGCIEWIQRTIGLCGFSVLFASATCITYAVSLHS